MRNGTLSSLWLPLLLLVTADPAAASIYRCESADGKIEFSDRPCSSGKAELLDEFERDRSPVVGGQFHRDGRRLDVVDGVAFGSDLGKTLNLVLVPRKLLSAERESLQNGDVGWLREGGVAGYVRVELLLDAAEDLDSLRHMRTIAIGLNENPSVRWTSNHGRSDIPQKVSQLDLEVYEGTQRIEFESVEISDFIRWDVALRLPVRRLK